MTSVGRFSAFCARLLMPRIYHAVIVSITMTIRHDALHSLPGSESSVWAGALALPSARRPTRESVSGTCRPVPGERADLGGGLVTLSATFAVGARAFCAAQ